VVEKIPLAVLAFFFGWLAFTMKNFRGGDGPAVPVSLFDRLSIAVAHYALLYRQDDWAGQTDGIVSAIPRPCFLENRADLSRNSCVCNGGRTLAWVSYFPISPSAGFW